MGIIKEIWHKCKTEWFVGLVFILSVLLAFGLGRWSALMPAKTPVTITTNATALPTTSKISNNLNDLTISNKNGDTEMKAGEVVASKQGSKYHLPTCPGAKQIKAGNLVRYESVAAAKAAGLAPAGNCPGL